MVVWKEAMLQWYPDCVLQRADATLNSSLCVIEYTLDAVLNLPSPPTSTLSHLTHSCLHSVSSARCWCWWQVWLSSVSQTSPPSWHWWGPPAAPCWHSSSLASSTGDCLKGEAVSFLFLTFEVLEWDFGWALYWVIPCQINTKKILTPSELNETWFVHSV